MNKTLLEFIKNGGRLNIKFDEITGTYLFLFSSFSGQVPFTSKRVFFSPEAFIDEAFFQAECTLIISEINDEINTEQ